MEIIYEISRPDGVQGIAQAYLNLELGTVSCILALKRTLHF